MTSDDVLLSLDVVAAHGLSAPLEPAPRNDSLDDLDEDVAPPRDALDNLAKSSVAEAHADPARVNRDHAVVTPVLGVTLDGALHRDAAVEDDVDEGRDGEDVGDRGEGRVLSERVTGERAAVLDESLGAHVLEEIGRAHV